MATRKEAMPKRPTHKQELGAWGETRAQYYLSRKGYHVLEKNWRCRFGEVDLICTAPDNSTLCFIEVRTSTTMAMGGAIASLTRRKKMNLCRVAYLYISSFPQPVPIRCDLIANQRIGGVWQLEHIMDAFGAQN